MSVISVISSPDSKGFGTMLADRAAEGARANGKDVETFHIHNLDVRPCMNCLKCRENGGHCVIRDDATPILEKIRESEGIIVTCQIRFARIDGKMKTFLDRFYCFMTDDGTVLEKGKKQVMIVTAGADDRNVESESKELEKMLDQYFLFEPAGRVTYVSYLADPELGFFDDTVLDKAEEAGRGL